MRSCRSARLGFARNIKAWRDEHADVVVLDKLPVLGRMRAKRLGGFTGFPNEAAALSSLQRITMGEGQDHQQTTSRG